MGRMKATQKYDSVTRKWMSPEKYDELRWKREQKKKGPLMLHVGSYPRANHSVAPVKNPKTGKFEPRVFHSYREEQSYYKNHNLVEGRPIFHMDRDLTAKEVHERLGTKMPSLREYLSDH